MKVYRDTGFKAAFWIHRPTLGQKQPHAQWREDPSVGQRECDERLTVGELPEGATVLMDHTDAVLTTLGERGVVDDQYAFLAPTKGLGALDQQAVWGVRDPGTDVQEMVETLGGQSDVLSDRFGAFAF